MMVVDDMGQRAGNEFKGKGKVGKESSVLCGSSQHFNNRRFGS